MRNFTFLAIACLLLLTSCASRYKRINPETVVYHSLHADNGVTIEYKYEVLSKKYKKKEAKKKIRVIAVKITNGSDSDKVVGQNILFAYQNGTDITLLDNKFLYKSLKQHPASHLLYMLLTPVNFYATTNSYSGSTTTIPVGLAIGPGLTLGNLLTAAGANRKFRKELDAKSMVGKTIRPGETVYGIIAIAAEGYEPIQIKVL